MEIFKILKAPPTIYYIPNFITEDEEQLIIDKVNSAPIPKWTQLSNRRLQNWGGIPHKKGMIAEDIPMWLQTYIDKVIHLGIYDLDSKPNHVLVNEYLPGQGIMSHFDGPLFYPTVTTISCGSHTLLELFKPVEKESCIEHSETMSLLLERRSLLVLQNTMYDRFQHSIEERKIDFLTDSILNLENTGQKYNIGDMLERCTRISLTIRHVPNTTKLKLKLGR
uniref:Fe2OG dioxygenase domain-containing protein n=1 Tax=Clastoptera arizonana TaxID=38151 RepID=A0A1B6DL64_9HEMI